MSSIIRGGETEVVIQEPEYMPFLTFSNSQLNFNFLLSLLVMVTQKSGMPVFRQVTEFRHMEILKHFNREFTTLPLTYLSYLSYLKALVIILRN